MTGIAWYIPSSKFDVMTKINEQGKLELHILNTTTGQKYQYELIMLSPDCAGLYYDKFIDEVLPALGIDQNTMQ